MTRFVTTTILAVLMAAASTTQAQFIRGIDTSVHQGFVNWTSVKNNPGNPVEFAFTKATEGVDFVDVRFTQNMTNAKAAGVLIGPYHFARPDSFVNVGNPQLDAINEANDFVDAIEPFYNQGGYLRPVLDVERIPGLGSISADRAYLSEWVRGFMSVVESRLGFEALIYANANYANNYFESDLNQYDLWLARWTYNVNNPPTQANLGIWNDWAFWQWSDNWSVSGISGAVDGNVFDGTLNDLQTFLADFNPVLGDFDNDSDVDADDIDLLYANFGNASFDLTGDGQANGLDVNELVRVILGTEYGDADLDGDVDLDDFNLLASNFDQTAGWAGGDFTGNTIVNLSDFNELASTFGFGTAEAIGALPEPGTLALLGVTALFLRRR